MRAWRRQRVAGSLTAFSFGLQVAQRAQLFDGGRHKTRILQNPVGDAHFLRNQDIVLQGKRGARARQIVELTARRRGGYTLFN